MCGFQCPMPYAPISLGDRHLCKTKELPHIILHVCTNYLQSWYKVFLNVTHTGQLSPRSDFQPIKSSQMLFMCSWYHRRRLRSVLRSVNDAYGVDVEKGGQIDEEMEGGVGFDKHGFGDTCPRCTLPT